jgi:N-acetylglucosamine-6-sulfatase
MVPRILIAALVVIPLGEVAAVESSTAGVESPPNVIVVMTDDQFPLDSVERAMPFLASRPGRHWVEFTEATNSTPLCCPSRATFLSGQYSDEHGVVKNNLAPKLNAAAALPVWLQSAGYETALIGKYLNGWPFGPVPPGWDRWQAIAGNTKNYWSYDVQDGDGQVESHTQYVTRFLGGEAAEFVDATAGSTPFFLWLSFTAPHSHRTPLPRYEGKPFPLAKSPNYNERDVSDKPEFIRRLPPTDGEDRKQLKDSYRTLLAVDDEIEDLYGALEASGELEDTVIMFMTDNGYAYGAHRWRKKRVPYEEAVRTPLLVRYPAGVAENRIRGAAVSNVDVPATIADLADAAPTHALSGESFRSVLAGAAPFPRSYARLLYAGGGLGMPKYEGVRTPAHKFVRYATEECELYDLTSDPWELENRCNDPAYADVQAELEDLLPESAADARRPLSVKAYLPQRR